MFHSSPIFPRPQDNNHKKNRPDYKRGLHGVSKNERLTRRFPRGRFRGRNPTETGLFCCLTKLCIIPSSMAVKKKTVQRSLDLTGNADLDEFGNPQFGGEGFTALDDGDTIVRTVRIDRLVRELGLQSVDLIEMDIEGTERHALAGAKETLARFGPEIIVCVHHLPDDPVVVDQRILSANPAYRSSVQERHAFYRVDGLAEGGKR